MFTICNTQNINHQFFRYKLKIYLLNRSNGIQHQVYSQPTAAVILVRGKHVQFQYTGIISHYYLPSIYMYIYMLQSYQKIYKIITQFIINKSEVERNTIQQQNNNITRHISFTTYITQTDEKKYQTMMKHI